LPSVSGPILEVGSRDYGSTENWRALYPGNEYLGVDLAEGKNVDRVVDLVAGTGGLPETHFALIICCSVLEHVPRPWLLAANMARLLRPGGALYIAVPWVWRYHPYPDDYFRFSWRGVAELFPGVKWSHQVYSTTVPDEFANVGDGVDNSLAQHAATPGGSRKYLPYLQVHMLGTKS
jgi:SAM-dependent methyltransferase